MKARALCILLCFACLLSAARFGGAQTSFPMIGSVFPSGVQRGKTTDITVLAGGNGGANLYGAYKVMVEGDGVKAEIVPPEKGWPAKDAKNPWALPGVGQVTMRVTVAPDAPLGAREFRIATPRMGISTLGQLVIGDEPEVVEVESSSNSPKGQDVPIPSVINGRINRVEDVDNYRFKAAAGQEIVFSVLCARLEDKVHDLQGHADPLLILLDANGKELIRNDDYYRADPLLPYKFEKAGEYVIQIRDINYGSNPQGGPPHWVYLLNATTRPYVTAVTPCAVRPGVSNELNVSGYNLGATKKAILQIPQDAPRGIRYVSLTFPNGTSNLVPILVTDIPQATVEPPAASGAAQKASLPGGLPPTPSPAARRLAGEGANAVLASLSPFPARNERTREGGRGVRHAATLAGFSPVPASPVGASPGAPNEPAKVARPLTLPGGVNSWLAADGQIDRYAFHAKAGSGWNMEVTARRLDSQLDSEIRIRDAKGNVIAENDDAFGKDSRLEWGAPADGDYTVEIRDLAGHSGPTYFYNLTAEPLRPDFRLKCDVDRAMIAPGNRTSWYVNVERTHGFAGPVTVDVKGLPAGVSATPLTIPPQMGWGTLILSAAPGAKVDSSFVQVIGTAMLPDPANKLVSVSQTAHPLTEIYVPGGGRGLLEAKTQAVAVTETNDLEVAANMQKVTLQPGGTAKIDVTLKRRDDYAKSVTLDVRVQHLGSVFVDPLPPGVSVDEGASKLLLGEKENAGYITLRAAPDAKPITDMTLAVFANVSINFVMKVWYAAPPIALTVAPPAKK